MCLCNVSCFRFDIEYDGMLSVLTKQLATRSEHGQLMLKTAVMISSVLPSEVRTDLRGMFV